MSTKLSNDLTLSEIAMAEVFVFLDWPLYIYKKYMKLYLYVPDHSIGLVHMFQVFHVMSSWNFWLHWQFSKSCFCFVYPETSLDLDSRGLSIGGWRVSRLTSSAVPWFWSQGFSLSLFSWESSQQALFTLTTIRWITLTFVFIISKSPAALLKVGVIWLRIT